MPDTELTAIANELRRLAAITRDGYPEYLALASRLDALAASPISDARTCDKCATAIPPNTLHACGTASVPLSDAASGSANRIGVRGDWCFDCGRSYGSEHGFPDLVVPHEVWNTHISPFQHEGGLLCPSCMVKRAHDAGLSAVPARFTSGPFAAHSPAHADAEPRITADVEAVGGINLADVRRRTVAERDYWLDQLTMEVGYLRKRLRSRPASGSPSDAEVKQWSDAGLSTLHDIPTLFGDTRPASGLPAEPDPADHDLGEALNALVLSAMRVREMYASRPDSRTRDHGTGAARD